MSPLMKKVEKAGKKGIELKRKPFKIGHEEFFDEADRSRALFSKLIGSDNSNQSVIIPSVSYGLANVAGNLQKQKGEILVVSDQFPSNYYPWDNLSKNGYKLKVVSPGTDNMKKGESWNQRILEEINNSTVLVAIGHVHWADGTLFNLKDIRQALDKVDGLLIIDGTQSIGALPFDVQVIRPDALICAAYKWLMGPYGIGMAYYGERFQNGVPIEQNWITRTGSDNFKELVNYQDQYREGALRYEMGERSSFIHVPMLNSALKEVLKWTPEAVQSYCDNLTSKFIREVQELGFEVEKEQYRANHLFGVRLPQGLNEEQISGVLKRRKVSVSLRGDSIRISPHVYNDEVDMKKLYSALTEISNLID